MVHRVRTYDARRLCFLLRAVLWITLRIDFSSHIAYKKKSTCRGDDLELYDIWMCGILRFFRIVKNNRIFFRFFFGFAKTIAFCCFLFSATARLAVWIALHDIFF